MFRILLIYSIDEFINIKEEMINYKPVSLLH